MSRSFKCCKNKEFSNYCCILCNAIFHPSCMDRSSEVVKLGSYKILCSLECKDQHEKMERLEETYRGKLKKLQNEIERKDKHIERLQRNSSALENEVSEAEDELSSKLKSINEQNSKLSGEIAALKKKEVELISQINSWNVTKNNLEQKIKDLTELNKNLLVSVNTLETENNSFGKDSKELRQKILDTQPYDSSQSGATVRTINKQRASEQRKRQILLIGGENARGGGLLVKKLTNHLFDVNCQVKRRALLADFFRECEQLCKNFDKSDFVVIFMPYFDAKVGKSITDKELEQLVLIESKTNLIVVGCSYYVSRPVMNNFIHVQNSLMQSYFKDKEVAFVPVLSTSKDGFLDYQSKVELLTFLVTNYITSNAIPKKNFLISREPKSRI